MATSRAPASRTPNSIPGSPSRCRRARHRRAGREIATGLYRGPLHGIPLALEDNISLRGEVTTTGAKIHKDHVPERSAKVVDQLTQAGAIITGKLNLHEYAWGATTNNPHFGACHNPWDLSRIPGGSIRIPSSFCGVVGLKPTHGLVSKADVFPLGWSLDHVGPIMKSVHDVALMMNGIAGFDANDPTSLRAPARDYTARFSARLHGVRVGINERYFLHHVDQPVEQAVRAAIAQLQELGATVHEVEIPALAWSEYAELGELLSSGDYLKAQQIRLRLDQDFAAAFREVDVLVSPTVPFLPPPIGAGTVSINGQEEPFLDHVIRFTGPGNLTGLPALSMPCGLATGLPVGLQITGPVLGELSVLQVAYALEQTRPMKGQKPAL